MLLIHIGSYYTRSCFVLGDSESRIWRRHLYNLRESFYYRWLLVNAYVFSHTPSPSFPLSLLLLVCILCRVVRPSTLRICVPAAKRADVFACCICCNNCSRDEQVEWPSRCHLGGFSDRWQRFRHLLISGIPLFAFIFTFLLLIFDSHLLFFLIAIFLSLFDVRSVLQREQEINWSCQWLPVRQLNFRWTNLALFTIYYLGYSTQFPATSCYFLLNQYNFP